MKIIYKKKWNTIYKLILLWFIYHINQIILLNPHWRFRKWWSMNFNHNASIINSIGKLTKLWNYRIGYYFRPQIKAAYITYFLEFDEGTCAF